MIASTGLDFVFLDTEHIVLDRTELAWMCQAYSGHGLAPIIRIPAPDPYRPCQMLDCGAAGVIAPYLESVDQVQQLRGAVKMRPLKGQRLQGYLAGKEQLEDELAEYLANYNRNNVCIVNIESVPALDALDNIVAVPGVDALLVGPHDLSINLGIPEQYDHPRFEEAIQTIIRKGRNAGIGVGVHYSDGMEKMIDWAKTGLNLIIHSSDLTLVRNSLSQDIDRFRSELGDPLKTTQGAASVDV
jgi:2-keto-3-deoxy-L-rhamnonate aldolase RhmA